MQGAPQVAKWLKTQHFKKLGNFKNFPDHVRSKGKYPADHPNHFFFSNFSHKNLFHLISKSCL